MTKAQVLTVARAIYKASFTKDRPITPEYSRLSPNAKSQYEKMAKAAITALSAAELQK